MDPSQRPQLFAGECPVPRHSGLSPCGMQNIKDKLEMSIDVTSALDPRETRLQWIGERGQSQETRREPEPRQLGQKLISKIWSFSQGSEIHGNPELVSFSLNTTKSQAHTTTPVIRSTRHLPTQRVHTLWVGERGDREKVKREYPFKKSAPRFVRHLALLAQRYHATICQYISNCARSVCCCIHRVLIYGSPPTSHAMVLGSVELYCGRPHVPASIYLVPKSKASFVCVFGVPNPRTTHL